jgi:predicted XRE-type DNA-binding protein
MKGARRNLRIGSSLDDFLEQEGVRAEFEALAVKEVIAWELKVAMEKKKISKSKMAELMATSRAQIDRLLDPTSGNVTLETLARAAHIVGRELRLKLV